MARALRIHTFGASGAGTTTLGRAVAGRLDLPQFDADDYFWQKTEPPFVAPHSPDVRAQLLGADLRAHEAWVLSGSIVGWGDAFAADFTLAVFVGIPQALRMRRLAARERERYGARIEPGGDMFEQSREFRAWAARYDTAGFEQRSRVVHEAWMRGLTCPVLRIEVDAPVETWCERVCAALEV